MIIKPCNSANIVRLIYYGSTQSTVLDTAVASMEWYDGTANFVICNATKEQSVIRIALLCMNVHQSVAVVDVSRTFIHNHECLNPNQEPH